MSGITALIGETLTRCENLNDEEIIFVTETGDTYKLLHFQDCCESVRVEDICGDLSDLVGSPILDAREDSNGEEGRYDHSTWTFYNLATVKGSVTIRWIGTSNGYYGEGVDFVKDGEGRW